MPNGEKSAPSDTPTVYIKSRHDDGPTLSKPFPGFNPDDLVGRTFLLPPGDNGESLRAKVTRKIVEDIEQTDGERVQKLSFILGKGSGKLEEIICYNQLVDHQEDAVNDDNEISDDPFKFRALIGHLGPLKPTDSNWKRCKYNVLVDWETGEKTYEPISVLAADDPVTCGIRQATTAKKYMFGYLIPRSYKEALEFDKKNNNNKWADATREEMDIIKEQLVFTKHQRVKWDSSHK